MIYSALFILFHPSAKSCPEGRAGPSCCPSPLYAPRVQESGSPLSPSLEDRCAPVRVAVLWSLVDGCREYSTPQSVATLGCWAVCPHQWVVTCLRSIVCANMRPSGLGKHLLDCPALLTALVELSAIKFPLQNKIS